MLKRLIVHWKHPLFQDLEIRLLNEVHLHTVIV